MEIKWCPACEKNKPLEYFYPYRAGGTRLRARCKECVKASNEATRKAAKLSTKRRKSKKIALTGKEKTCKKCGKTKDLALFSRSSREKDGRQVHCKACQSEYNLIYTLGEK